MNKKILCYNLYRGGEELVSHHAGYTDDEIFVPLILIKTNKD